MATRHHIRNPVEWAFDQVVAAGTLSESTVESVVGTDKTVPVVRRITLGDLEGVLSKGLNDTLAYRTDVLFLCLVYPVIGLFLMMMAFNYQLVPLVFPLASGFALIGPVAAVGLYEMSRRRELGLETTWADAFGVVHSRAFGAIFVLGLLLVITFLFWMIAAYAIYQTTLGPELPVAISSFVKDVFTTKAGWAMIALGVGVGFLFALAVLSISAISFPLLLDRQVGVVSAVYTSIRAVAMNPVPMTAWGMIVAMGLVLGSLPLLLGLIIVMPILGHASWHLYRNVVSHKEVQKP